MTIGILTAMDIEYRHLVAMLGGQSDGRHGAHSVIACQTGIGKVNAAVTTCRLIADRDRKSVV